MAPPIDLSLMQSFMRVLGLVGSMSKMYPHNIHAIFFFYGQYIAQGGWHITAVRAMCQIKPTNYAGVFDTNNHILNKIWYTGMTYSFSWPYLIYLRSVYCKIEPVKYQLWFHPHGQVKNSKLIGSNGYFLGETGYLGLEMHTRLKLVH